MDSAGLGTAAHKGHSQIGLVPTVHGSEVPVQGREVPGIVSHEVEDLGDVVPHPLQHGGGSDLNGGETRELHEGIEANYPLKKMGKYIL